MNQAQPPTATLKAASMPAAGRITATGIFDTWSGANLRQTRTFSAESQWGVPYSQSDPIGLEGGINLYGYSRGNPLKYSDSQGLSTDSSCEECPGESWIFYGVEAGGVVKLGPLGYGVNFGLFEARCLSSKRTCLYWTNCARLFGLGAFLGASGGGGLIFNAPSSDDIAGESGGIDIDLTTLIGPGGSGGVDVGRSGTIGGRVQFTIGAGEAVTFNICDVKKVRCRK